MMLVSYIPFEIKNEDSHYSFTRLSITFLQIKLLLKLIIKTYLDISPILHTSNAENCDL